MKLRKNWYKHVIACLASTMLLGCVSLRLPTDTTSALSQKQNYAQRQVQLVNITQWAIQGAFSIQYHDRNDIANYWWWQKDDRYRIRIASSLNLYTATMNGTPNTVLFSRDDHHYSAATPEQLMQQQLGWMLPVRNLVYWLRDLTAPNISYRAQYDALGHLVQLQQQGWIIQFTQFDAVKNRDLPRLLNLSRPGIKVRIVIKQWKI